jgi:hypothetical protein
MKPHRFLKSMRFESFEYDNAKIKFNEAYYFIWINDFHDFKF